MTLDIEYEYSVTGGSRGERGRQDLRFVARVPRAGRPQAAEGGQDAGLPQQEEGKPKDFFCG